LVKKNICMRGAPPSGTGVEKLALSTPEPSLASARTASPPTPAPAPSASVCSKLREAWVKPTGACSR
jgi:hypothetical protein